MRQAGWDLGPFAASAAVLAPRHLSSSNRIQRNCMGLKITVCMVQLGQILDPNDTKRPKKPNCHF